MWDRVRSLCNEFGLNAFFARGSPNQVTPVLEPRAARRVFIATGLRRLIEQTGKSVSPCYFCNRQFINKRFARYSAAV